MTTRPGSTGCYPAAVHDALMSLTLRMVEEYPELPAGSVMRSVARAVRRTLTAGTPYEALPARAEHAAHRALALRLAALGEEGRRWPAVAPLDRRAPRRAG